MPCKIMQLDNTECRQVSETRCSDLYLSSSRHGAQYWIIVTSASRPSGFESGLHHSQSIGLPEGLLNSVPRCPHMLNGNNDGVCLLELF